MGKQISYILGILLVGQLASAQPDELDRQPIDSTLAWLAVNVVDNPENYHQVALQTLARAYRTEAPELIAAAHDQLATWHGYHRPFSYDSVLYHSIKTVAYLEQTDDEARLAESYLTLASDYINVNRTDRGQELIFKAIAMFEAIPDKAGLGKAYRRLATLYNQEDQTELAIQYGKLALETARASGEQPTQGIALLELTEAYLKLDQFEQAFQAADAAIQLAEEELPMPDYIGVLLRAYANRGEVAVAAGLYERGLQDHTQAWELAKEAAGETPGTDTYRIGIGEAYFLQGNYKAALPHFLVGVRAFDSIETFKYPQIWEHYRDIAKCYEQLGQYQLALAYQKRAKTVYDTLTNNTIANLKSEALVKYETGKKDQALAAQAETIRQKIRIQWLSLGVAGLLVVLLGTLFFFYRKNQKSNAALAAKNEENELLLKEIHHRVKNNLEMVSSLLKLQAVKVKDDGAREVMQASQNRVQSMGILHQKLYQGKNLGTIEMLDYFKNLSENILDAYGVHEKVRIHFDMQPVELDVDTAVPIGLIVNELLTNSLKYAFPEGEQGEINLSLKEVRENQLHLLVADNGIGQTAGTQTQGTGFGTQLIQLLTNQLQGTMQADYKGGTKLFFQLEKANLS